MSALDELTREIRLSGEYLSSGLKELGVGVIGVAKGVGDLAKGFIYTAEGFVLVVDATALALGALAIMAVGGTVLAPAWAAVSRDKNIIDTEKMIGELASHPFYPRVVGYLLLGILGGAAYDQLNNQ